MNAKMGNRKYGQNQDQVFLGRQMSDHSKDYSEETAREIDEEIRLMIEDSYQKTVRLLKRYMKDLRKVSKILLEQETIEGKEFLKNDWTVRAFKGGKLVSCQSSRKAVLF